MESNTFNLRMTSKFNKSDAQGTTYWTVTLHNGRKRASFAYSMGSAHKNDPKLHEVLYSLHIDSQAGEMSLHDFSFDFGYSEETAATMHKACQKTVTKLVKLLGGETYRAFLDTDPSVWDR